MIFTVLDIYIFKYKVRINTSQAAICESARKYCESITSFILIIANRKFLLTKFSCLCVRYNLRKKVVVSNNLVENFYSISPLPLITLGLFSVKWQAEKKLSF